MIFGISARSSAYVRRRATQMMQHTCRIERVQRPVFNMDTGYAAAGGRVTVYEGPCRVWEVQGGSQTFTVGGDDVSVQNTNLSIPWDTTVIPERKDEVIITAHPSDSAMVGKRFSISDIVKAGDLRATRRFALSGSVQGGGSR